MENTLNKKEIKRQRTRQFFLDATREIILKEGCEFVTVRKVADLAGYTYPTLYHYFADLNQLLWETKQWMVRELVNHLLGKLSTATATGIEKIIFSLKIYISFYFENPNVFRFFYHTSLKAPEILTETEPEPDFTAMWASTFHDLIEEGTLQPDDLETLALTIIYTIHGMITLSLSNAPLLTEEAVNKNLENIIHYVLRMPRGQGGTL